MKPKWAAIALSAALLSAAASCASLRDMRSAGHCPVVAVSAALVPGPLPLHVRMRFRADDREAAVDVVAARDGENVLIIGLAPFGPRVFTVRQVGQTLESSTSAPFGTFPPPSWVFDALQRSFWITAPVPPAAGPGSRWEWEGERVSEVLDADGKRRREFTQPGDDGAAVIEYPASTDQESDPIVMHNSWCGFEAKLLPIGDRRP